MICYDLQIVGLQKSKSNFEFLIIAICFALPDLIYERKSNVMAVVETEGIILDDFYLLIVCYDNNQ